LNTTPTTLGDALHRTPTVQAPHILRKALSIALLTCLTCGPIWWLLSGTTHLSNLGLGAYTGLALVWVASVLWPRKRIQQQHPLLAHDRQGFMAALRLSDKTAIIDGSNLYHFGHNEGLDAQPLGMIAEQLRAEGYRIISFFDANIFYTLRDHGAFGPDARHTPQLLHDIFGLNPSEIYVVPSGTQADKYILDSLKHLPKSFAITNDQFRDYRKHYSQVMKGDQWRKGVAIKGPELKLKGHKFKSPLTLG